MCCAKVHKVYYEKIFSLFTYEFQVKMVLGTPSCKYDNHRHVCDPSVNIILEDFHVMHPRATSAVVTAVIYMYIHCGLMFTQ